MLDGVDFQRWERRSIEANVGGQKPITVGCGMSSNHEVGENSPSARVPMFSASLGVSLESAAGGPPYRFAQVPIDGDSRVFKKRGHESFRCVL